MSTIRSRLTLVFLVLAAMIASAPACSSGDDAARASGYAVERIAAIGKTESDYISIFERRPSGPQLNRFKKDSEKASQLGFQILTPGPRSMKDQFMARYATTNAEAITLVGHNKRGVFVFPDGSTFILASLRNLDGPIPVVISCTSRKWVEGVAVGVDEQLPYSVAFETERRSVNSVVTSESPKTIDRTQMQAIFMDSYDDAVRAHRTSKVIFIGLPTTTGSITTGAIGITIYRTEVEPR